MKAGLAMDYGKQSLALGSAFRRLEWDHRRSHPVSNDNSVTCWLDGVKLGDGDQIQRLWDRYFERLVRLAGSRLPGHSRRAFDEEDVALSAFQSFCDGITRGQFPHLAGRDDLWRLLATITTRVATELGTTRRTIDRKLRLIRALWQEEAG